MARRRSSKAPSRVAGLPKGGALYGGGARKAAAAMQKQYGPRWKNVYYGLANKRAGKGVKGKDRMHGIATTAYAKGNRFGFSGRRRSGVGRRRLRG